ncbi:hypothetical protein CALCODRAFT_545567 [Calocera cornea HHB12733]|uniref:Uncharacterized protein n=1 Tax=Calocera cornea HHB12733 TaxID=1353952 RepID=A0A165EVG1_9BASI|nr:hypothetical protein CALCODRAFT_545567 [Calocera cornea HHB12733]
MCNVPATRPPRLPTPEDDPMSINALNNAKEEDPGEKAAWEMEELLTARVLVNEEQHIADIAVQEEANRRYQEELDAFYAEQAPGLHYEQKPAPRPGDCIGQGSGLSNPCQTTAPPPLHTSSAPTPSHMSTVPCSQFLTATPTCTPACTLHPPTDHCTSTVLPPACIDAPGNATHPPTTQPHPSNAQATLHTPAKLRNLFQTALTLTQTEEAVATAQGKAQPGPEDEDDMFEGFDNEALAVLSQIMELTGLLPTGLANHLPTITFDFQQMLFGMNTTSALSNGPFQAHTARLHLENIFLAQWVNTLFSREFWACNDNLRILGNMERMFKKIIDVKAEHYNSVMGQLTTWAKTTEQVKYKIPLEQWLDRNLPYWPDAKHTAQPAPRKHQSEICDQHAKEMQAAMLANAEAQRCMRNTAGSLASPITPTLWGSATVRPASPLLAALESPISIAPSIGHAPIVLQRPANPDHAPALPEEVHCIFNEWALDISPEDHQNALVELHNVYWYNNPWQWYALLYDWLGEEYYKPVTTVMHHTSAALGHHPSKLSWKHHKAISAANQEKRALVEQLLDEAKTALNEALQDIHDQTGVALALPQCLLSGKNNAEAWQLAEARHIEQHEKKCVAHCIDYKQWESDTIRTANSFQEQAAAFSSHMGEHTLLKTDPVTFAQNFRAFCTSGGARGSLCLNASQFGRDIEDWYQITLQGWPLPSLKNPSEVSNIAELDKIRAALDDGACFFRHMTTIKIQQQAVVHEQELVLAKEKRMAAAEQCEASKAISAKCSLPVLNKDQPLNMASTSHT